jgi:hypothetical protein
VAVRRDVTMRIDSLDELGSAFAEWRRRKRHAREPMPAELLARARRATEQHGIAAVVGVTRVERARLFRTRKTAGVPQSAPLPAFSRLELSAPAPLAPSPRPIAEVETGSGVTLRVFAQTPEMMGLLSAVCGCGGVR